MNLKGNLVEKIFLIGFNKCGTTTFWNFFVKNNIKAVHWDYGNIARNFYYRKSRDEPPMLDYGSVFAFTDMICVTNNNILEPYKDFDYIFRFYPTAYYILNTRNVLNWIESRCNHHQLLNRYKQVLRTQSDNEVIDYWLKEWFEHHQNVIKFFNGNNKFLYYDIENDPVQKVTSFLKENCDLNEKQWEHKNVTNRLN